MQTKFDIPIWGITKKFWVYVLTFENGLKIKQQIYIFQSIYAVRLVIKELLNKEQTGFKELFTDYQPFYTINLLLNKEL